MIVTEAVTIGNREFIHNYSDEDYYIKKQGTDEIYSEAFDVPYKHYTYEETDEKIEEEEEENANITKRN